MVIPPSRLFRRFLAARRGATAVEFALVAGPFFFLIFAILEATFLFFVTSTMENGTMEASRLVRTGQLQMNGGTAADFRDAVCEEVEVVISCEGNVYVDVRVYNDFDSVSNPDLVSDGEFDPSGLQADFGDAGDIVVARVYYIWKVFTPGIGTGLANLDGGRRLIVTSSAFRNEPFGDLTP